MGTPNRETVDLSGFPDLVVIYLGMRVNTLTGIKTVMGLGPQIKDAVASKPDGLLLHEDILYSLCHVGMRQYWRDFETLEAWSRSGPHLAWWKKFIKDSGGTGFWHETYLRRGGIEAVYLDMPFPVGLGVFAPRKPARGAMFSARARAEVHGDAKVDAPVTESEFYR
jgi:hypothetical protein